MESHRHQKQSFPVSPKFGMPLAYIGLGVTFPMSIIGKHGSVSGGMLALLLIVAGCRDTVMERHASYEAARAAQLFDRGWLPETVPVSLRDLRIETDLDVNTAEGEFFMDPRHTSTFQASLRRMNPAEVLESDLLRYLERGYWPHEHRNEQGSWIFFIDPEEGHVEFRVGPR